MLLFIYLSVYLNTIQCWLLRKYLAAVVQEPWQEWISLSSQQRPVQPQGAGRCHALNHLLLRHARIAARHGVRLRTTPAAQALRRPIPCICDVA